MLVKLKKILINIGLIITFLIIYFLQVNFFTWFKIAGVMPNLFVILILYIGLFTGRGMGAVYGIIFGILLDLFIGTKIGMTAIMLGAIGIIAELFDKNFSKDSRMTIMIMAIGSTIVYEVGMYLLNYIMLGTNLEIIKFIEILLIEVIYNTIITIILYPLIQKTGYGIEKEYKRNRILTRYF